jgi:hypothetical protein
VKGSFEFPLCPQIRTLATCRIFLYCIGYWSLLRSLPFWTHMVGIHKHNVCLCESIIMNKNLFVLFVDAYIIHTVIEVWWRLSTLQIHIPSIIRNWGCQLVCMWPIAALWYTGKARRESASSPRKSITYTLLNAPTEGI